LTLTLAAAFMIGGLGYWSKEDPRSSGRETPTRLKAKEKLSSTKPKDLAAEPKEKKPEENK
jgi:hypothetical protein